MAQENKIDNAQFFKGKVLIVYLINPPEAFLGGIAINNPEFEERYGRCFLVGEVPPSKEDWSSGLRIGISFDQIAHFLEFRDLDEYLEKTASGILGKVGKAFQ